MIPGGLVTLVPHSHPRSTKDWRSRKRSAEKIRMKDGLTDHAGEAELKTYDHAFSRQTKEGCIYTSRYLQTMLSILRGRVVLEDKARADGGFTRNIKPLSVVVTVEWRDLPSLWLVGRRSCDRLDAL